MINLIKNLIPKKKQQKGQSLVEILLTIGLAAVIIPSLYTGIIASRNGKAQGIQREQAVQLLKETESAIKSIRNNNWDYIVKPQGNTYHTNIVNNKWELADNPATINGLTQQINFYDVNRNPNTGAIVTSGGTTDPSTKRAQITISWTQPQPSSLTSTIYLTRTENQTYKETTKDQFDAGTLTNVVTTNTSGEEGGGEVSLGAGGGNWCNPNLSITSLDLPGSGITTDISALEGHASTTTGQNSAGNSLDSIDITNTNPPTTSLVGSFDGYKVNGIFRETNYAYLATDDNQKEIVIVDHATNPYSEVGSYNIPGNTDANDVYASGNTGYATANDRLYLFNVSNKSNPTSLGSVQVFLGLGTPKDVIVLGNYAYVTVSGSAFGLQIFNVSNPNSPQLIGYGNFNFLQTAAGLHINETGTRAYMALTSSFSFFPAGFYIINTSDKSGTLHSLPPPIGAYQTNGMEPKGIAVVTDHKAIVVGSGGEEYQVVNISNESDPTQCGGMQIDSGINGIASVLETDGDAYSYIITGDATSEFKIIEGGNGSQFEPSGIFESAPFDTTSVGISQAAFNYFEASISQPSDTEIKMQVAVAPPGNIDCSDAEYQYLGPNGDPNQFFTVDNPDSKIAEMIPFGNYLSDDYQNPSRCFRYKVYLSTPDSTQTPTFYDIIWNYSP